MTTELSAMGVRIEPVVLQRDSRGSVFEPFASTWLPSQRNLHVVVTEPGCVRGNHYHTRGTEILIVQGPALVRMREGQRTHDTLVPDGEVIRCIIPPRVAHAVQNLGTGPMLLLASSDLGYDPEAPDVVPAILITA
jgi:UDP-2-acetamido-2,6-beta-L-arabino-hexul-4-ose reductase